MFRMHRDRIGDRLLGLRTGPFHRAPAVAAPALRLFQVPQGKASGKHRQKSVAVQQQRRPVRQGKQPHRQEIIPADRLLVLAPQMQHQLADGQAQQHTGAHTGQR